MDQTNQTMESSISPADTFGDTGHEVETQTQTASQTQTEQTQSQTSAQAASPNITPEMIAQAVATGVQQVMPRQSQQPQAPTPEEVAEFEKQFNVVKVNADIYKQILGVAPQNEQQVQALQGLLHGAAKQAIAMSTYMMRNEMQQRLQQVQQQFAPVNDYVTQQQVTKIENDFLTANPDLKDHQALVKEIAIAARASGQQFKSRDDAFKFVADRARSLLGKAAPAGQPASRSPQATRKYNMTPTSLGGNPGGSRQPQAGSNATVSPKDVFGGSQE